MDPAILRTLLLGVAIAALGAAVVATPARAQEPAHAQESAGEPAAASGDASQAAPQARAGGGKGDGAGKEAASAPDGAAVEGVDLVPRHGAAGLERRANIKTLIANAPNKAGFPYAAATHLSPSPPHSWGGSWARTAVSPRNAIGAALPALRPPAHESAGFTTQTGAKLAALGTGTGGIASHRMPVPGAHQPSIPPNAGTALRGAAINGTAMRQVATSSIGGPAKDHSGINGTSMKPKH